MRYDTTIYFHGADQQHYDPDTSEYVGTSPVIAEGLANVTDTGTDRSQELFGDFTRKAKVIRLRGHPPDGWAYLQIGESPAHYVMQTARQVLKGNTLIVGERK